MTVNRNCGSSLQAINDAAMSIAAELRGRPDRGGVEHMDHIPMSKDYSPSPGLIARHGEAIMNMGLTAEYLAAKYRISRKRQDEFALRSHRLAAGRPTPGLKFRAEIAPTWGRDESRAERSCSTNPTSASAETPRSNPSELIVPRSSTRAAGR